MAEKPNLTPYTEDLGNQLDKALRALLRWPPSAPLTWEDAKRPSTPQNQWQLRLRFAISENAAADIYLSPAQSPMGPSFGQERHISIFSGPGNGDGIASEKHKLERSIKHMEAAIRRAERAGPETEPLATFLDLVQRYNDILHIDTSFRRDDTLFRSFTDREALIRLGFRCDQDCWFCWQGRRWPEPPGEYYLKWLDEMAEAGAEKVVITGGEPTNHKFFLPLVERASKHHGLAVHVQTNAIRFGRKNGAFAKQAHAAGVKELFVSYHSADAQISDTMTRAPDTHEKTVAGIQAALGHGILVVLNCCIVRDNYQGLKEHAHSILERFVEPFPENPVFLVEYSHAERAFDPVKSKEGSVPFSEVRPFLHDAIRTLSEANIKTTAIGPCGYPPCLFHGDANLLLANLVEPTHESDKRGRQYVPICENCTMQPHCLGLRTEYLDQHSFDGVRAFTNPIHVITQEGSAHIRLSEGGSNAQSHEPPSKP